jgi:hypothetical protein
MQLDCRRQAGYRPLREYDIPEAELDGGKASAKGGGSERASERRRRRGSSVRRKRRAATLRQASAHVSLADAGLNGPSRGPYLLRAGGRSTMAGTLLPAGVPSVGCPCEAHLPPFLHRPNAKRRIEIDGELLRRNPTTPPDDPRPPSYATPEHVGRPRKAQAHGRSRWLDRQGQGERADRLFRERRSVPRGPPQRGRRRRQGRCVDGQQATLGEVLASRSLSDWRSWCFSALIAFRSQIAVQLDDHPLPATDPKVKLVADFLERSPGADDLFDAWDVAIAVSAPPRLAGGC